MDIKILGDTHKFKVRVSGIVIINNKLLTTKYGEESYCLPGGYVEIGENTEQGVIRELFEELQIKVKIDSLVGIIENFYTNFRNVKTHGIDFFYKVSPKDISEINQNDYEFIENDKGGIIHHSFKWLDINTLEKYDLKPNVIIEKIKNQDFSLIHNIENE